MNKNWTPSCISVGSGNISIEVLLGIVCAIERKGLLETVTFFSASGNGSFIAVLLYLGWTTEKICNLIKRLDLDKSFFYDSHSYQFAETSTAGTSQYLLIEMFFSEVFNSYIPTFDQLFLLTGRTLYLSTYNMSKRKHIYLSYKTHPHMSIVQAIHLATGVRYTNCEISYDGDIFMDASCVNPLPLTCFNKSRSVLCIKSSWLELESLYSKTDAGYCSLNLELATRTLAKASFKNYNGVIVVIDVEVPNSMTCEDMLLYSCDQALHAIKSICECDKKKLFWTSS